MKMAIVNAAPPYSGLGKYAFSLFERLRSQGKDVDMLYCETPGADLPLRYDGVRVLRQRIPWPFTGKTFLPQYHYFPSRIPEGYGIYHVAAGGLARVARFRQPTVITHHDAAALALPEIYSLPRRVWCRSMLRHYANAQKIIAISEGARHELLRFGGASAQKIKVIHPGYDETLYKPRSKWGARKTLGLPQDRIVLLHVGSEELRKDVPTLLKAVHELQRDMPDVMLVRVGTADKANMALKKQIAVRQYSNVPEPQIPLFYNTADLFVFPSVYEGFGMPVVEAMASGVPVIITDALKLFQKSCAVVRTGDASALALAMREILGNPERYQQLQHLALNEVRKYTLSQEVEEIYRVYEEVFAGAREIHVHP